MSTRARWSKAPPLPSAGGGVSQTSAKEPMAAGRQTEPGFTTSRPSTNCPEAVPVADGKMRISGTSPSGKSRAAARASDTMAGSRGNTGKRRRCSRRRRRARSMRRSSGRTTRPERIRGLSASADVTVTRRPSILRCEGFGRNWAPKRRNCSAPFWPSTGPRLKFNGGWGNGWKLKTSSREGRMKTSVEGLALLMLARPWRSKGSTCSV
mmetsp:Transcript_18414/g.52845  ORF Transcript_18414/g.52845 Transcript_18414/m.52845 type:complete len:209 (+) Transcript_18414:235-861(+)